jgi:hypothetical protein
MAILGVDCKQHLLIVGAQEYHASFVFASHVALISVKKSGLVILGRTLL